MKDIKINRAIINERRELSLNLLIKEGDYTLQEYELTRIAKIDGNTLDLEITGLTSGVKEQVMKEKRAKLAAVMYHYCQHFNCNVVDEEALLYNRLKVRSRTELNEEQLDREIESYGVAVISNIK